MEDYELWPFNCKEPYFIRAWDGTRILSQDVSPKAKNPGAVPEIFGPVPTVLAICGTTLGQPKFLGLLGTRVPWDSPRIAEFGCHRHLCPGTVPVPSNIHDLNNCAQIVINSYLWELFIISILQRELSKSYLKRLVRKKWSTYKYFSELLIHN